MYRDLELRAKIGWPSRQIHIIGFHQIIQSRTLVTMRIAEIQTGRTRYGVTQSTGNVLSIALLRLARPAEHERQQSETNCAIRIVRLL